MGDEEFLTEKLEERKRSLSLRTLKEQQKKVDFYSNDYLGLARNESLRKAIAKEASSAKLSHGSSGSRLLSGNHPLFEKTEKLIAKTHHTEAALIFNSGYDANVGLLSSIARRGDAIIYDSLIHASLRDGIRLSLATAYSFLHNNLNSLEAKLKRVHRRSFVVVESVYSMDGDQAPLEALTDLCVRYSASLIVDEAHATGVIGSRGEGLVQHLGLANSCFARVHTFGKALGVHGAAVVGSETLKQYLVNYARTFIYTTALPPVSVAAIAAAYQYFPKMKEERRQLQKLIAHFQKAAIPLEKLPSDTPIQILMTPGNEVARRLAGHLQNERFDIKPILYPTIPKGKERLRVVLHSFNTMAELQRLITLLQNME
jgi:8-amino-7-oxononanoate synthase